MHNSCQFVIRTISVLHINHLSVFRIHVYRTMFVIFHLINMISVFAEKDNRFGMYGCGNNVALPRYSWIPLIGNNNKCVVFYGGQKHLLRTDDFYFHQKQFGISTEVFSINFQVVNSNTVHTVQYSVTSRSPWSDMSIVV